ncbi:MAG: c-type cytochrome [Verrucomicrobia bacterium]|nr:c-type cytochrome [Verrucomicrobiota bacterium]
MKPDLILIFWAGVLLVTGASASGAAELSPRLAAAVAAARDSARPEGERLAAIRRLGNGDYDLVAEPLFALLESAQPEAVRLEVVRVFAELAQPRAVAPLLKPWTNYFPALKQQVFHTLTSRRELAREFVTRLEAGALPLAEVDTATRQRLINSSDEAIAARAQKLFDRQPWMDAKATLQRFKGALQFKGDAKRGKEVFKERSCVNCHRIGDEGHFVGADLFTIKDMPREELLQQIVAPNLFFMPTFQAFVAETKDDEIVEGVLAGSTEATVTIRQALGIDRVFNKSSLRRLKGLNVSLMPEGLLEGLSPQQVADLLAFIQGLRGF